MEHEQEVLIIANRPGQERAIRDGMKDFRRVMRPARTKYPKMGMFGKELLSIICFMALCYLVAIFL